MEVEAPWQHAFEVRDAQGELAEHQGLPLTQVSTDRFSIGATLCYLGDTGLDPSLDTTLKTLPLDSDRFSDLASVPAIMRWFVRSYGLHTPAALFHDYWLSRRDVLSPVQADRFFLAMLDALGVPAVMRYIMWAAVSMRTQWERSRVAVVVWVLLSATGLALFVLAVFGVDLPDWMPGRLVVLIVAGLAPLPASLLWPEQGRAALVAAVVAIWLVPASLIALGALWVYAILEWLLRMARPDLSRPRTGAEDQVAG